MFESLSPFRSGTVFSYVLQRDRLDWDQTRTLARHETLGRRIRKRGPQSRIDDMVVNGFVGWAFSVHGEAFPWRWSLTHTGQSVAVAISLRYAVGIDIEEWNRRVPFPVGLTSAEDVENRRLGEPLRSQHFLTLWVQKEARFKAQQLSEFRPREWEAEIVPDARTFQAAVESSSFKMSTNRMSLFRFGSLICAVAATRAKE